MNRTNCRYLPIIQRRPVASAVLSGSEKYPDIRGIVRFCTAKDGVLVYADVGGLPHYFCYLCLFSRFLPIINGEVMKMNDKKKKEQPIPKAYPEIDTDLARDDLGNDIPDADLQDI